jgi:glycosyltransferase involved in cell wall biosynthesis
MPLVSIVMNVRNGAATLREAIDSVLSQTCNDWELIVWDDRSTDASAQIVSQYRDARVHYFLSPADTSLGEARSQAIQQASGEWVAFLDQDDIWLPHKLEQQLALADSTVGLIYGRTVRFYPNGTERDYDQTHEYQRLPEGDIFTQLFTKSCFPAMSSAMFRRSAIADVGGIPSDIHIIPDYALYVAVARRFPVRAVQEVVCRYRMHPESMSHTVALDMHREVLRLVDLWAASLDAKTVALCRRRHSTAIALQEMRNRQTLSTGITRLLTQGSPASQMARPFLALFHLVRRNVKRPYWRVLSRTDNV